MRSTLTRKKQRRVGDMTFAELRSLVQSSVRKNMREILSDPETKLELRPEIADRLLQQESEFAAGNRGRTLAEVGKRLKLD